MERELTEVITTRQLDALHDPAHFIAATVERLRDTFKHETKIDPEYVVIKVRG